MSARCVRRRLLFAFGAWVLARGGLAQDAAPLLALLGTSGRQADERHASVLRAALESLGYSAPVLISSPATPRAMRQAARGFAGGLLFVDTSEAALAARAMQARTPIIGVELRDAEARQLTRRGIAGFTASTPELALKRLDLLRDIAPVRRPVLLLARGQEPLARPVQDRMRILAVTKASTASALARLSAIGTDGLIVDETVRRYSTYRAVAEHSLSAGIPSAGDVGYAEAGGLIGYAPDADDLYRRAAVLAQRMLNGATDVLLGTPQSYRIVASLRAARALSLDPSPLVSRGGRLAPLR